MTSLRHQLEGLSGRQLMELARRVGDADPVSPADSSPLSSRLVAYVVPRTAARIGADELRQALNRTLPDYMVPSVIVFLDALPLTPNGKVDRNALPEPVDPQSEALAGENYLAPRTDPERALAQIWAEVLGFDDVGVRDNFFEMGGDSLLTIRIIARAAELGLHITPDQFVDTPTIEELAVAATVDDDASGSVSIHTAMPASELQKRWLMSPAQSPDQIISTVLLYAPGDLDTETLAQALSVTGQVHEALRLRVFQEHGEWFQQLRDAPTTTAVGSLADRTLSSDDALAAARERLGSLLAEPGGVDFAALVLSSDDIDGQALVLAARAVCVDAGSWSILLADLEQTYIAISRGLPAELPPAPTPFRVWVGGRGDPGGAPGRSADPAHSQAASSSGDDDNELIPTTRRAVRDVTLPRHLCDGLSSIIGNAYGTRIDETVLAIVISALAEVLDNATYEVVVSDNVRAIAATGMNLSRTVGSIGLTRAIHLILGEVADPGTRLIAIKEQLRNQLSRTVDDAPSPDRHQIVGVVRARFRFFAHTHHADDPLPLIIPHAFGGLAIMEADGPYADPIEIVAIPDLEGMRIIFNFESECFDESVIEDLAQRCLSGANELIEYCVSTGAGTLTPSDFPLAALDQSELDHISDLMGDLDID